MIPENPILDETFRRYAELQLHRHALLESGEESGAEIEDVEHRMTESWEGLNEAQRASLNGMASDLNWLRRRGEPAPKGRLREEVTPDELKSWSDARLSGDGHKTLHWLRLCSPAVSVLEATLCRGEAYQSIGLPKYAGWFYEFAADRFPSNPALGVIALCALERTDFHRAVKRAERILDSRILHPPTVVAMSAFLVMRSPDASARRADDPRFALIMEDAISLV